MVARNFQFLDNLISNSFRQSKAKQGKGANYCAYRSADKQPRLVVQRAKAHVERERKKCEAAYTEGWSREPIGHEAPTGLVESPLKDLKTIPSRAQQICDQRAQQDTEQPNVRHRKHTQRNQQACFN